jgi:virginiamycin B lyase
MRSLVGLSAPKCDFARAGAFWIVALLLASAANSPAQVVATINEFPVPTTDSEPVEITPGPDGALWFTELNGGKIGRITISGAITEYAVGTADTPISPAGITAGPDGALWFTDAGLENIGRVTTWGEITQYPAPRAADSPEITAGITAGPDGALWFTEYFQCCSNAIVRITTSGLTNMYPVADNSSPFGITAGPDGALWFTESVGNKIGRITTSGEITEYPVPTADSGPYGITAGPDGALWFAENNGSHKIGRITTSGEITEYLAFGTPEGITAGPDGALWFTSGNKIGRITTSGEVTKYRVPTAGSGPAGITVGPDGALWFTELNGNQIGQVVLAVSPRQGFARPIPMGVSVGNTPSFPLLYAGTAGLLVHSVGEASKFILSNNHVLGAVAPTLCPNTAAIGKTWTLQPATLDIGRDPGNDPSYQVGVVAKFWEMSRTGKNVIDAAVSATNSSVAGSDILGIGQLNGVMRSAAIDEGVVKSGRTTGVTVGTVTDLNATITVGYHECGSYTFAGQIAIFGVSPGAFSSQPQFSGNPFSRGGDSGSVVLDAGTSTPVGLLFAGDPLLTYANPISSVYNLLQVFPDSPNGGGPKSAEELKAMEELMQETLDPRLARLEEIQARHEDRLLSLEGVHGVGIGLGENGRDFVFDVFVTKRTPELEQAVSQEIEGVPVRLVETGGPIKAY